MEQQVNTFTEGLLSDTNPMMQGNNSLTDALNATFITMNGNEVVLQNDMGNRRIEDAYLPSGYEPVGIKEYGGIIYVAAYNPITNKSLIGSFPSPERNKNSYQDKNYKKLLNLNFPYNDYEQIPRLNGLLCIKSDSILIPLTKDDFLHAGDKFTIYSTDIWNLKFKDKITNFDNTDNGKVKSPKNKEITLSVGILNSQNEFVDITKTLYRWNAEGELKEYKNNESDLFKFNDGYFISTNSNNIYLSETQSDEEFIRNRLSIAINTYSYKLVGPMYIKAYLNHILNFDYNIYGTTTEVDGVIKSATLWIEGYISYNCPDFVKENEYNLIESDIYNTYETGKTKNFAFDLFYQNEDNQIEKINNINELEKFETVYNPESNLYTTQIITKHELIEGHYDDNNMFRYIIGVRAYKDAIGGKQYYLSDLSNKGIIDLSLLGSNTIKITSWRFFNNFTNGTSTLSYSLLAYPERNKEFRNLRLEFYTGDKKILYPSEEQDGLPVYNGRTTVELDWDTIGLEKQLMYDVVLLYDVYNNGLLEEPKSKINKNEWFLTTELFNECYDPNSEYFMEDFGEIDNNIKVQEKFTTIFPNILISLTQTSSDFSYSDLEGNPNLIQISNTSSTDKIRYVKETTIDKKYLISSFFEINRDLYPKYVFISENPELRAITFFNLNNLINQEIGKNKIQLNNNTEDSAENYVSVSSIQNSDNSIDISIKCKDVYEAPVIDPLESYNVYIENGFTSMRYGLSYLMNHLDKFSGIVLDSLALSPGSDHHNVFSFTNYTRPVVLYSSNHSNDVDFSGKYELKYITSDDGGEQIKMSEIYYDLQSLLKNSNGIFTYIYNGCAPHGQGQILAKSVKSNPVNNSKYYLSNEYCRVWWKTINGEWALIPNVFLHRGSRVGREQDGFDNWNETNVNNFINKIIPEDAYYCFYNKISLQELSKIHKINIYIPNSNKETYNLQYEFTIPINFMFTLNNFQVTDNSLNKWFTFTGKNSRNINKIVEFDINSSEEFQSLVKNSSAIELNNIFIGDYNNIGNGKSLDKNNQTLVSGNLYKKKDGELLYWDNNIIKEGEYSETYNGIYCNDTIKSEITTYPYDFIEGSASSDSWTYLYYDEVEIINTNKIV